jgi:Zn-dependent protease with chaperone function
VSWVFRGYPRLYDAATSALRRANEREADRAAVAATGRDVMASAAPRLPAFEVAWDAVLSEYAHHDPSFGTVRVV